MIDCGSCSIFIRLVRVFDLMKKMVPPNALSVAANGKGFWWVFKALF
jgi:hypothetical protein